MWEKEKFLVTMFNTDNSDDTTVNLCKPLFLGPNSLPNNKIFDLSKLKAFANDKINVTEKLKFVL